MTFKKIFVVSIVLLLTLLTHAGEMQAASPVDQEVSDQVLQVVLVLDVSGSMGTEVYTGIVPEDLLTLLLRKGEIQENPDFIQLEDQIQELEENLEITEAEEKYTQAREELDDWLKAAYGRELTLVRRDIHELLGSAGCSDELDLAITTSGDLEQLDFSLNTVCPPEAVTFELRQQVIDLLPYLEDPEYLSLREKWIDAFRAYDDLLEESGLKSAQQQLEDLKLELGYEEIEEEIDRLVDLYNIPTRLDLAKSAAINLIDLSRLDQSNTGRESEIGLVTFSNQALLEQSLTLQHDRLKSIIRSLSPQFQTNIGDGLNLGLSQLRDTDSDQPLLVILLSDGHANVGMSSAEILAAIPPRANDMDAIICTAGFADLETEVDFVLLEGLAQKTDGEYLFTNSGAELGSFFVACREAAVGKELVGQITSLVEAGSEVSAGEIEVEPHTCELNLTLNFLSGSPMINLIDPEGHPVQEGSEGFSYQTRNQVQLITLQDPLAGEWTIKVTNDDQDSAAAFSILVSSQTCEGPAPETDQTAGTENLPFYLSEKGIPIFTGAVILVLVVLGFGVVMIVIRRQRRGS